MRGRGGAKAEAIPQDIATKIHTRILQSKGEASTVLSKYYTVVLTCLYLAGVSRAAREPPIFLSGSKKGRLRLEFLLRLR